MIEQLLSKMIEYNGSDTRRIGHALKVFGFACAIGGGNNLDARAFDILKAAAVLHDIGIHEAERKYNSSAGEYQEREGPAIARSMLDALGADNAFTERVCYLVGHHHSYALLEAGNDTGLQILIEADFIVNIEEDGLSTDKITLIRNKYFKTAKGIELLDSVFCRNGEIQ